MGRTQSALAQRNPTKTLAQWLESLRQRSGLSWGQTAQTAAAMGLLVSQSTLFRAAQGEKLPKWKTVQAFTRVCGGDEREAKRLWSNAGRYEAAQISAAPRIVALPPQFITEPWQLIHAMNHMRREHGSPTLRELEEKAMVARVTFLPRSTVSAVLRGRMPTKDLLRHFVRYCGNVPKYQVKDWEDAWERVNAHRKGETCPVVGEVQHELKRAEDELARTRYELDDAHHQLTGLRDELERVTRAVRPEPTVVALPPHKPGCLEQNVTHTDGSPPQGKARRRWWQGSRRGAPQAS